jgi:hypothetical protein
MILLGCLGVPTLVLVALVLYFGPRQLIGLWQTMRLLSSGLGGQMPSRINLEPATDKAWRHRSQVKASCRKLQEAGFQPAGSWTIREMPGMALAGLVDPRRRLYAAVYDMPVVGVWVGLFCLHTDGSGITATNATMGWELDLQPDREKAGSPGAPIAELLQLMDVHPRASDRIDVSAGELAPVFEAEYAREQDWRLARGGVTVDEVRRMAEESGDVPSEEELEEVARSINERNAPEIAKACVANYLDEQGLRGGPREALEPYLIAIHERMTREQAMEFFAVLVGEDARQLEDHPVYAGLEDDWEDLDALEVFSRLAGAMSHPSFPRFQGRVRTPIAADVYMLPAESVPGSS